MKFEVSRSMDNVTGGLIGMAIIARMGFDWFVVNNEYSGMQVFWEKLDIFRKDCKYLGKSKANINDLFKTENEE